MFLNHIWTSHTKSQEWVLFILKILYITDFENDINIDNRFVDESHFLQKLKKSNNSQLFLKLQE